MSSLGPILEQLLPPVLWRRLRGSGRIRYAGRFASWSDAAAAARGYSDPAILERVAAATRAVADGRAACERDGCVLARCEHRWPVLAALFWSAASSNGRLQVLDFGGALGGTYFQLRSLLRRLPVVEWSVVEQRNFVEVGRREFSGDELRFFESVAECIAERTITTALFSSVLQYLENPWAVVRELCDAGVRDIVIDRTLFARRDRERICVQRVPASLGGSSYPCRLLSLARLQATLAPTHTVVFQFDDELDHPPRDGWFGGMVCTAAERRAR